MVWVDFCIFAVDFALGAEMLRVLAPKSKVVLLFILFNVFI